MGRLLFIISFLIIYTSPKELNGLVGGYNCRNFNTPGICTPVTSCPIALESIRNKRRHDFRRCGFDRETEIVCCPNTDEIDESALKSKVQRACENYSKMFPMPRYHYVIQFHVDSGEYPHMAALGFYSVQDKVYRFDCGGTLISERYIVTAACCIFNVERNDLKIARMGVVSVPDSVEQPDPKLDYEVEIVTVHREFKWKGRYNDIALVKLAKDVIFNENIKPACLYTNTDDPERPIVTGWGIVSLGEKKNTNLRKVFQKPVPLQNCNETYVAKTKMNIIRSQICATDESADSCPGDSGGALQIHTNISLASIVGITSYRIGCGSKYPGIYTRIQNYLDWIEKIVWP